MKCVLVDSLVFEKLRWRYTVNTSRANIYACISELSKILSIHFFVILCSFSCFRQGYICDKSNICVHYVRVYDVNTGRLLRANGF